MAPPRTVLMSCGSYNPPTNMHLRMFEIGRDHLHKLGTHTVVGGIISPVHDSYSKTELASMSYRCEMVKLALQNNDWIKLSTWETRQYSWTRTRMSLQHHQNLLNSIMLENYDTKIDIDPMDVEWIPQNVRNSSDTSPIDIKLLCGGDLLESFATPGLWAEEDIAAIVGQHGLVVITREGSNPNKFIYDSDVLTKYMHNIHIVTEWIPNEVSSTRIRRALRRGESVKYLVQDAVIDYIYDHGIYNAKKTSIIKLGIVLSSDKNDNDDSAHENNFSTIYIDLNTSPVTPDENESTNTHALATISKIDEWECQTLPQFPNSGREVARFFYKDDSREYRNVNDVSSACDFHISIEKLYPNILSDNIFSFSLPKSFVEDISNKAINNFNIDISDGDDAAFNNQQLEQVIMTKKKREIVNYEYIVNIPDSIRHKRCVSFTIFDGDTGITRFISISQENNQRESSYIYNTGLPSLEFISNNGQNNCNNNCSTYITFQIKESEMLDCLQKLHICFNTSFVLRDMDIRLCNEYIKTLINSEHFKRKIQKELKMGVVSPETCDSSQSKISEIKSREVQTTKQYPENDLSYVKILRLNDFSKKYKVNQYPSGNVSQDDTLLAIRKVYEPSAKKSKSFEFIRYGVTKYGLPSEVSDVFYVNSRNTKSDSKLQFAPVQDVDESCLVCSTTDQSGTETSETLQSDSSSTTEESSECNICNSLNFSEMNDAFQSNVILEDDSTSKVCEVCGEPAAEMQPEIQRTRFQRSTETIATQSLIFPFNLPESRAEVDV